MMNRLAPLSVILALPVLASGCFGTEGGNPIDPLDAGLHPGEGGVCHDGGTPEPLCERGPGLDPACPCAAGDPYAISVVTERQRAALMGPTPSGGFVALLQRTCAEGCTDTMRYVLEVHRFDATGARAGDPIEVSRSASSSQHGAVLEGTSLALAWGDERRGPSGASDIWFARLDLATGAWSLTPRPALTVGEIVTEVGLARAPGGYHLVYPSAPYTEPGPAEVFFVRLDGDGAAAAGPTRISDSDLATRDGEWVAIAPRVDGSALARWSGSSLRFVALAADGTESAPPALLASVRGERRDPIVMRPSGTGYVVGWSDGVGVRLARTDATGGGAAVIDLAAGTLRDLVVEDDGTIAVLWRTMEQCARTTELILTRVGLDGARLHPDVLVHRDSTGMGYGGALVDTADGLRATYTTYRAIESTSWIVPACAPL